MIITITVHVDSLGLYNDSGDELQSWNRAAVVDE